MALSDTIERIRRFWDEEAAGYDRISGHYPQTPAEWAARRGALEPLLPPAPCRVLDVGAGTGFLTMAVAGLGHVVTAVDLSGQMLARLTAKASAQQFAVTAIQARADQVPQEGFDVVMSRHLLWTLPDPDSALRAWRAAAPGGRLVLVDSVWGAGQSAAGRTRPPHRALAGPALRSEMAPAWASPGWHGRRGQDQRNLDQIRWPHSQCRGRRQPATAHGAGPSDPAVQRWSALSGVRLTRRGTARSCMLCL